MCAGVSTKQGGCVLPPAGDEAGRRRRVKGALCAQVNPNSFFIIKLY